MPVQGTNSVDLSPQAAGLGYNEAAPLGRLLALNQQPPEPSWRDRRPPKVANYKQRAGRAGRRAGMPAYVLSFVGERPHDVYYWEHPTELIFGEMSLPQLYLDNEMIRARHLRAEALSAFLRQIPDPVERTYRRHDQIPRTIQRDWQRLSDFVFGGDAVKPRGQPNRIWNSRYPSIVNELSDWCNANADAVEQRLREIADVPDDIYDVAADLAFQLAHAAVAAPFDRVAAQVDQFRTLGGPNGCTVDGDDNLVVALSLEAQLNGRFDQAGNNNAREDNTQNLAGYQAHLLTRSTIQWLSRLRVLPKYGFPVDVINLLPHQNDIHKRNVDLDRDLRIGLFSYAPGQNVFADKRIYPSTSVKVFRAGGIGAALRSAALSCALPELPEL